MMITYIEIQMSIIFVNIIDDYDEYSFTNK